MTFQQVPSDPTLWLPHESSRAPGAHALVIGISDYPALDGSARALGLSGLHTSALTAFTFFRWLTQAYDSDETPLESCRLLLSPLIAELALAPAMHSVPAATFVNCRAAINAWYDGMEVLHSRRLESTRAIFFFSGHGSQVTSSNRVLLPSDYLSTDSDYDAAMSTLNLNEGLQPLSLLGEYFFVDACGSRLPWPHAVSGARILDDGVQVRAYNPDRERVSLHATKAGTETWQPDDPVKGISIFGQALIEGLTCAPADPGCNKTFLSAGTLHPLVSGRASSLMTAATGRAVPRSVLIDGPYYTGCICSARSFQTEWWTPDSTDPLPPPQYAEIIPRSAPTRVRLDAETSRSDAYEILRSETLTSIWQTKRVHNLEAPKPDGVIIVESSSVAGENAFAIEFTSDTDFACALELRADQHWFALLPQQEVYQHVYEVHFSRDRDSITRFEVGLSLEQSASDLQRLVRLLRMSGGDLRQGIRDLTSGELALESTLAMGMAGALLSRHNIFDGALWTELETVAETADARDPDIHVLLAERARRTRGQRAFDEISERTRRGLERGVPRLGYVFELLLQHLQLLRQWVPEWNLVIAHLEGHSETLGLLELTYLPGDLFTAFDVSPDRADAVRQFLLAWR